MSGERLQVFVGALVAAGADAPFEHDGLIYFLVPKWVVDAYAVARFERRPDVLRALVTAHCGAETVAKDGALEGWLFWRIGRAWQWRLGELERRVRGKAAA